MAGIPFSRLVEDFVDALERFGANVIRSKVKDKDRPARFQVQAGSEPIDCWLFLWTITPGGGGFGVRPANERRIQITGIAGMPFRPGVRTILGGWNSDSGAYAFWDARRHTQFSSKSPSLQVDLNTLESAGTVGIASQLRPTQKGQEVVIACTPYSLGWYVEHMQALHNMGENATEFGSLLNSSAEEEQAFLDDVADDESAFVRRYDLVQNLRAFRDAQFRPSVLQAFSHRCAVCDCDLKLVDAAHIIPVSHPRSTDDVTNGLALCRLHHAAFDNALLGVQSNYRIVINPDAVYRLHSLKFDRALEDFTSRLPERIRVPASIEARPAPRNLTIGLEARHWPSEFVA
ncbi:MAG: HNH endonuclease [Planctomycetaceae bacterium]